MTERILCVDDDRHILAAFQRVLRSQFLLETAVSGAAGLDALESRGPFAVVVSDMRMPSMDGAQFLAAVRQRAPDTVRIMLTGQVDVDAAIAAVNEGNIFRFLTKPCPPAVLTQALDAALTQYRLVTAERTLLTQTLHGSIKVLTEVLALVNPTAFGRAVRLKRYVHHLVTTLDLADGWQFELAAMLSQLGCVALPTDVLERAYAGHPLSPDEERLFTAHPAVGYDLLRHIPRLETIAAMIARQRAPHSDGDALPNPHQQDMVRLGAHMLQVVLEFDALVTRGLAPQAAVTALGRRPDPYGMVAALGTLASGPDNLRRRTVTVRELCTGMILDEDVCTQSGVLVLAKGHEVTDALLYRLRGFAQRVALIEPFRVVSPPQCGV